ELLGLSNTGGDSLVSFKYPNPTLTNTEAFCDKTPHLTDCACDNYQVGDNIGVVGSDQVGDNIGPGGMAVRRSIWFLRGWKKSTRACKEVDIAGLKLDEETKSQMSLQLEEEKGNWNMNSLLIAFTSGVSTSTNMELRLNSQSREGEGKEGGLAKGTLLYTSFNQTDSSI
ncbi:hypothetical protein DVH24_009654, partial [Malus domestica]